ncbi:MAG TPA: hypothetical protein VFG08_01335 [Candidatus Polarisedimenticolia bacterium]|nr:hypothetical protein [Candidatus Polarisedimenticolia bacterium]
MTASGRRPAVLLLGAEETPALPIIWSLAARGVPITAGSHRRAATGLFSRHPRRRFLYPDPAAEPGRFVDAVLGVLRSEAHAVTLACGEEPTWLLSQHKAELERHTSIPIVDPATFLHCRDKSLTMKAAAACGVPTPITWYPEDDGIDAVARDASYPAVLKPCISDGARGISFPATPDDLRRAYEATRLRFGPCIVQERIPHDGMQFKAEFLLNRRSEVRLRGAYAKLRYYPPTGGSSTLNRTVHRPDLLRYGETLLTHLGWYGMGDCDFILDPRDDVAKLMEVNPRFTRTIRVLVEAGLDYPYELYRLALGEEPRDVSEYEPDVYLRYLPADLVWFLRSPERFRARPSFFRFIARRLRYEEWSLGDPLTGFGFWLSLLADMASREERRKRLR